MNDTASLVNGEATRFLCVLFADVCGSSVLYETLGDAEARRAVERCLNRIERAAVAHRGRLVKTIGDEALIVFDTAEQAFLAACEMQQKVDDLPPVSGHKLAIHIGFHAGEVVEDRGDVFGSTVNTAARLVALAKAGQIITDDHTVKQLPLPCLASVRQLDPTSVKGRTAMLQLWEGLWRAAEDLTLVPHHFAPTRQLESQLRLSHAARELFVGSNRPRITLGRSAECDLVVQDPRASREHARIEWRQDKFVLVDNSTNGTYVTVGDEPGFAVRREETVLRGKGRISFGRRWKEGVADVVDYAVIG